MKIETSEIIDMSMDAGARERIFNYMKHKLFHKMADEIQFPSGKYLLTLQTVDAPFDGFRRRISIRAEIKKDATIRDDLIRLPSLNVGREADNEE